MKRTFCILMIFALLLAGCTTEKVDIGVTEPMPEPTETVTVVSSVDEFLAALKPGATIQLGEGYFYLNDASDYGDRVGPYYIWTSLGDDQYGLQLQYLEDVTILGSGKDKTKLATEPRWPDVLKLMDCKNVTIADMTIGHTQEADACEGGVVYLDHCENVELVSLGLFGCGTVGVWGYENNGLLVKDCDIYDCSSSGISLNQNKNVAVQGCNVYSLGKDTPVVNAFEISTCRDVTVENCTIRDNYVNTLISCAGNTNVAFRNNQFTGNRVSSSAFSLNQSGVVFDGNTFEDNTIRTWYTMYTQKAVDAQGKEIEFEEPEKEPQEPGVAEPVSTGEQKEVTVKTVDQFLAAIASDTKIILAEGTYDLSTAKNYGNNAQNYYWEDNYDGPSLVIAGVTNLTVEGAGQGKTTISAVPRYANVLTFENCFGITVKNFTAGHTIEPGYCMGGVLMFRYSDSLLVENCGLYGCGTYGVQTDSSPNLQIVNCEIYECSYGGVQFWDSENISISGTTFRDLEGPIFSLSNCVNVTVDGEALDGNYLGD